MKKVENIQLLYTLLEVYYSKSLSGAASRLGKTTSAVSKDISKLRVQFGNPLFVRSHTEMLPTAFVSSVVPEIEERLTQISNTLNSKILISCEEFDQPLRIAVTHVMMEVYGDEIAIQLSEHFPNANIELSTWDLDSNHKLQQDYIDFGIHYSLVKHPGNIQYKRIIEHDMVIVCPSEYKLKPPHKVLKELDFLFLRIKDWNDTEKIMVKIAAENHIHLKHAYFTDSLSIAVRIVKRKGLGFLVPKIIAEHYNLHYLKWPLPINGLTLGLYYNTGQNESLTKNTYDIINRVFKATIMGR